MQDLEALKQEAVRAVHQAVRMADLRDIEVRYLGRSGKLTEILRGLKNVPESERKEKGKEANTVQAVLEREITARRVALEKGEEEGKLAGEKIDITQPGVKHHRGGLHPLTLAQRDIARIFSSLGFEIVEGPEVETEFYNFDALNIPADHPARDMWDTFWIKNPTSENFPPKADSPPAEKLKTGERLLLRTHTSPMQVRYMETHQPPFRIIVPGRAFRYEATDASHDIQFYQLEGLMVGRDVSLSHFRQIVTSFLSAFFSRHVEVRLRPSYFPFVEPGVEVDMKCIICQSKGCSVCKHTGWLEMLGAGMVHPKVFKAAGLDPKGLQGFAFGIGIDRLALMKYKIPDIRLFYSGDIRFLRQF